VTDQDVGETVRRVFERVAELEHAPHPDVLALKLLIACDGRRIRFVMPPDLHDPDADHRIKNPGDQQAGARLARAALYGEGTCPLCRTRQALTRERTIPEHEPDTAGVACLGDGLDPITPDPEKTDDPEH